MSIPGVPAACLPTLIPLTTGEMGTCLATTGLVGLVSQSGSIVEPLNGWLTTMCAASPCSESNLNSTITSLNSGSCAEAANDTGSFVGLINLALVHYTDSRALLCSKDGDAFCVTQTLSTIQNETNTPITFTAVQGLLNGNETETAALNTTLQSGKLCTTCVNGLLQNAERISPGVQNGTVGQAFDAKCAGNLTSGNSTATNGTGTAGNNGTAGTNGTGTSTPNSTTSGPASPTGTSAADQLQIASALVGTVAAGVLAFSAYVL